MNPDEEIALLLYTTEELAWLQTKVYDICTICTFMEWDEYDEHELLVWLADAISIMKSEELCEYQWENIQIQQIEDDGELWENYEILLLL